MHTNSNCYCTSVVIKVPGIQGTGIIWETLTDEEKQDISNTALTPIREYIEESKAEVKTREETVNQYTQTTKGYKEAAEAANEECLALSISTINNITSTGSTWKTNVINEGNTQVSYVTQEGLTQIEHIQNTVKAEESTLGVRCYQATYTIEEDKIAHSVINLPYPMYYLVGRDHLKISWNGLSLTKGESFLEKGLTDNRSSEVIFTMPLKQGDVITAWTVPLGRGSTDELIDRVTALENALAELSRVVVYRE